MLEALSLAAGLSWASGLRLYLTVFVAGLFERTGLVHLPDTLSVLGSPWVIGVAAVLAIVEFFADKIPAFDSSGTPFTRSSGFRPAQCSRSARSVTPIRSC